MKLTILSPMYGEVLPLSAVKDEVFAKKLVGDGVAVRPSAGEVYAPCTGVVSTVAETGHAVAIRAGDGVEVLVHVGVDTAELHGRPFCMRVAVGDMVKAGDLLFTADLEAIAAAGCDTMTPVVLCETGAFSAMQANVGAVTPTDWLMRWE